ncbi:MAG: hypothetical protein KIG94_07820 [Acetatifactor sp.]|nr:hypothetical protein [Acetatifactor sp.]
MEYLFVTAVIFAVVYGLFLMESLRQKKEEKKWMARLYDDYFFLNDKTIRAERFEKLNTLYLRHPTEHQIDDITWNDLGMDKLFQRMNYTLSSTGEEYLYYRLRTLNHSDSELKAFDDLVSYWEQHPDDRVRLHLCANKLGYLGKYSLYDYIENLDYLGERSNLRHILQDLLFLPAILLGFFNMTACIIAVIGLMLYNMITYFREKGEIEPYITSFAYVLRLINVCEEAEQFSIPAARQIIEQIRNANRVLKPMRRNSFWVMSSNRGGQSSSDILGMLLDYVRMVFHVDLIKFNRMLQTLRKHTEEVDTLVMNFGLLECSAAIMIYRQSMCGWCRPEFTEQKCVDFREAYHPLLESPVKNSIRAERGVLLTGSNASGKSTFLKTVAVNAILAQSIYTCAADSACLSFFDVYSSMALRDDIGSGESYYIVEIKALKRILDAGSRGENILCFVDEVLRGTNTVERIAASTQIMKSLDSNNILCFAATHDIELTTLLERYYDNYHFEEEVCDGDIVFHYKLLDGKAVTRNAIRLLQLIGYDEQIIQNAAMQAEQFVKTGVWSLTKE